MTQLPADMKAFLAPAAAEIHTDLAVSSGLYLMMIITPCPLRAAAQGQVELHFVSMDLKRRFLAVCFWLVLTLRNSSA